MLPPQKNKHETKQKKKKNNKKNFLLKWCIQQQYDMKLIATIILLKPHQQKFLFMFNVL